MVVMNEIAQDTTLERRGVVVGVDGSAPSKEALSWAARYARLAGEPLHVLVAWRLPPSYGWEGPYPADWDPEAEAKAAGESAVREVLGGEERSTFSLEVVEGHPARVLTDASKRAVLVVVGSRGRGEFAGMLLGSVSEFLTAHAHCPVVVVRDGAEVKPAT